MDLVNDEKIKELINYISDKGLLEGKLYVSMSIKNSKNIDKLLDLIYLSLPQKTQLSLKLPINKESQSFISDLYNKTGIIHIDYNDKIVVSLECNEKIKHKIISECKSLNGEIIK
jgi:50S ribosomal subunit-associated GTPase HflX